MSLFSRLALGFVLAIVATLGAQALFWPLDTNDRIAVQAIQAQGPLVKAQGDAIAKALDQEGESAAKIQLQALQKAGFDAWLVRQDRIVGLKPMPIFIHRSIDRRGLGVLGSGGTWVHPLSDGKSRLVVHLARSPLPIHFLRLLSFLGVPLLICFLLSKWLSAPIVRLERASSALGAGNLAARVGPVSGFREATELAHTFDAMAERNQRMIETQKRFLADVSHEIRSPLARIRLAAEMAGKGDVQRNLNRIIRDVGRLDELVESLSVLVKTDNVPIEREEVALHTLVREICDGYIEKADFRLQTVPVSLFGDRRLLHSAVENVIRNAITYSGDQKFIEVSVKESPVQVVVRDSGPGVPEEELERIFHPFTRVSEARERNSGGIGLGLAIVERATSLHGGTAVARNHPDGGLEITLTFRDSDRGKVG